LLEGSSKYQLDTCTKKVACIMQNGMALPYLCYSYRCKTSSLIYSSSNEAKQILSSVKFKDAKIRLSKTKRFLEILTGTTSEETTGGIENDFTTMKAIFWLFFTSLPKIELVIGSPVVKTYVEKQLETDEVSCVCHFENTMPLPLIYSIQSNHILILE